MIYFVSVLLISLLLVVVSASEPVGKYEIIVVNDTCIAVAPNDKSYFYRLKFRNDRKLIDKCKNVVLTGFSSIEFVRGYTEGTINDMYMLNTTIGIAPFVQSSI